MNMITGGAFGVFVDDPLTPLKASVAAEQNHFTELQGQWQQCMTTCQNCITQDEFTLIGNQLAAQASNQAVINEQIEEQIMTLATVVGFILVLVMLIFAYILSS